jgi:nucleoside-diphosphate-sugar epimerase
VGANLVRRLLAEGHDVTAAVRPGGATWRLEGLDVRTLELDLRESERVDSALRRAGPEWVFHLAAHGSYSWQADSASILQSTVLATAAVVEAAARVEVEAFVNAGSSSEYGVKDHAPGEDEALEPNSVYGVGKAAATLLCRHAAEAQGLPAVTLRLYSVYGPYEDPRRFVPTLVSYALRGELPPLVEPETARDFVYVDDVVEAFLRAAERGSRGAVYNVGSGSQTTIREAVDAARRTLGVAAEARWTSMPARSWDTSVWVAAVERARSELGWTAHMSFDEGLRRTADWLQAEPRPPAGERLSRG